MLLKKTFKLILLISFILISLNNFCIAKQRGIFRKVGSAKENISISTDGRFNAAEIRARKAPCKISEIQIPEDIGIVKDSFRGTVKNKLVVHIQDAHCHYEAQSNIYKIIEHLTKNNNLRLLCLEGGDGVMGTDPYPKTPERRLSIEIADYLLRRGKFTGPEYIVSTSDYKFFMYGIEDNDIYLKNLYAFRSSYPHREKFNMAMDPLKELAQKLKEKIFSPELLELDKKTALYAKGEDKGGIGFSEYCTYLIETAKYNEVDFYDFQNMERFSTVADVEDNIDFKKVDEERMALIEEIRKNLSRRYMSELVLKTNLYRKGRLTSGQYHQYIANLGQGRGADMTKYANLDNYSKYMIAYEKMDKDKLMTEKDKLETAIKELMYENNEQKILDDISAAINKTDQLYQLEMTNDDVAYYRDNKEMFSFKKFVNFLKNNAYRYNIEPNLPPNLHMLDKAFADFEDFYYYAELRDDILINNTLDAMEGEVFEKAPDDLEKEKFSIEKKEDEFSIADTYDQDNNSNDLTKNKKFNICVMVCGGYHTQGMTRKFKKDGISYVVLAPRITKEDKKAKELYISLLLDTKFDPK